MDENVTSQELLLDMPAGQLILTNTRANSTGNKYDYVVGTTCKAGEGHVTVTQFSLPNATQDQLLPRGTVREPSVDGFTRNFLYLNGFDIRSIGSSANGHHTFSTFYFLYLLLSPTSTVSTFCSLYLLLSLPSNVSTFYCLHLLLSLPSTFSTF